MVRTSGNGEGIGEETGGMANSIGASRLVGRESEERQCAAVLNSARQDRVAHAVRITGPSGIGKTAFMTELAERAREQGWIAPIAAAHRIQSTLPFVIARKVLAGVLEALGDESKRYISGLEAEIAATINGTATKESIEGSLHRILEAVSLDHPVLLVVDDAQWADLESRVLFDRVLLALADRALVLLAAERTEETLSPFSEIADTVIALGDLDESSLIDLAQQLLPGASAEVLTTIAQYARGRALDVVAIANSVSDPASLTPPHVASTLRTLVARDLKLLAPTIRDFLQTCSLISEPIDFALLQNLWPDEAELMHCIKETSGQYLVQKGDALHFVHGALAQSIRETVAIEIPIRKRIIDAIERMPTQRLEDIERLVEQASASGDRTQEKIYLKRLQAEGERLQVLPVEARALNRILEITPFDPTESLPLYTRLSMIYNIMYRRDETHRVCAEALSYALSSGIKSGIGQLVISDLFALFFQGEMSTFERTLERFDRYLSDPSDRAHLVAAKVFHAICDDDEESLAAARSEFTALHRSDTFYDIRDATFEAWRVSRHGDTRAAKDLLERARALARGMTPLLQIMITTGDALISFQEYGVGHPEVNGALGELPAWNPTRDYVSALSLMSAGHVEDVMTFVSEALIRTDDVFQRRLLLGVAGTTAVLTRSALPSTLRRLVAQEEHIALRDRVAGAQRPLISASAGLNAQENRVHAKVLLDAAVDAARKPLEPMIVATPYVLVRAAELLEDRETLELLASDALPESKNAWNAAQGQLTRTAARSALGRNVSQDEKEQLRTQFEALGAPLFAQLAALPTLKSPSPEKAEKQLTRRELEVSRLIADGCTNRDIASRLVLSERTVEAHVANIFGKLSASTRSQVAAWYVRQRGATGT